MVETLTLLRRLVFFTVPSSPHRQQRASLECQVVDLTDQAAEYVRESRS
jgi:hypothetical protein